MKILIYALNFKPEMVGCGKYNSELADWLTASGHEVRVICAPPYYPQWQVQKPFSPLKYHKSTEKVDSRLLENDGDMTRAYTAIRCPIYVPKHPTGAKRLLHLSSFAISSLPALLAQISWKPEIIFTVAPTLLYAPFAAVTARLCGAVAWLHIQDFETDAAFEIGLLKHRMVAWVARLFEKTVLTGFSIVSSISQNMLHKLHEKGVADGKTYLLPNWVDVNQIKPLTRPSKLKRTLNLAADLQICLFSGNLGTKQGLEMIITAASLLKDNSSIHFVICGNGPQRLQLQNASKDLPNITFIDLQPPELLNELLNIADIHLLPQLGNAADLVMPSKLTGMLASGRPVVASAAPGTEIARALHDCGLISPPGDYQTFADNIRMLVQNHELRLQLGNNARRYALAKLDKPRILQDFNVKLVSSQ
ncbi:MAG: glycosyltransferase WbuB [Candidatus Riflebacteria bacterium]|nr:glycosyltransferase WbuB [Candidatus Riflebacteria bacterium]